MTYVMFLTLDESGPKPYLKVVKKEQEVAKNKKAPQKLSWRLSDNAYKGTMQSFKWLDPVPSDTFGPAVPTPAGKRFNMDDTYDSDTSYGTWRYELKAKIDGTTYSTTQPGQTQGVNDPTIRNK